MPTETQKNWAVQQLRRKAEELGSLPQKSDFDEASRARIKAFLGPWPRALESAGLKTPSKKNKKPLSTETKRRFQSRHSGK